MLAARVRHRDGARVDHRAAGRALGPGPGAPGRVGDAGLADVAGGGVADPAADQRGDHQADVVGPLGGQEDPLPHPQALAPLVRQAQRDEAGRGVRRDRREPSFNLLEHERGLCPERAPPGSANRAAAGPAATDGGSRPAWHREDDLAADLALDLDRRAGQGPGPPQPGGRRGLAGRVPRHHVAERGEAPGRDHDLVLGDRRVAAREVGVALELGPGRGGGLRVAVGRAGEIGGRVPHRGAGRGDLDELGGLRGAGAGRPPRAGRSWSRPGGAPSPARPARTAPAPGRGRSRPADRGGRPARARARARGRRRL